MQTEKRLPVVSIVQELLDEPQRFQLMQAVRILLRWLESGGIAPEDALGQAIRFENSLSLQFPASEIDSLQADAELFEESTGLSQPRGGSEARIALTPSMFGLLGVGGALPLSVSERIAEAHYRSGDAAPHAFANLFFHRLMVQFFQAWGKNRLEHRLGVEGKDNQLPLLSALAGLRQDTWAGRPGLPNDVTAYYAAILGTRPVALSSVSRVLAGHFGVPIELEPFVATWDYIPDRKRSRLGGSVAKLGYGAVLGRRLLRRDLCARLNVGPLCLADVERFLPGRPAAIALAQMVSSFGLANLKIVVRLLLEPSCIQRTVLTSKAGPKRRLGWDAFLPGRSGNVTRTSIDFPLPSLERYQHNAGGPPL